MLYLYGGVQIGVFMKHIITKSLFLLVFMPIIGLQAESWEESMRKLFNDCDKALQNAESVAYGFDSYHIHNEQLRQNTLNYESESDATKLCEYAVTHNCEPIIAALSKQPSSDALRIVEANKAWGTNWSFAAIAGLAVGGFVGMAAIAYVYILPAIDSCLVSTATNLVAMAMITRSCAGTVR